MNRNVARLTETIGTDIKSSTFRQPLSTQTQNGPVIPRSPLLDWSKLKSRLKRMGRPFITPLPWRLQDQLHFFCKFGRFPNLRRPVTFNEKVLYRKTVHGDHDTYRPLADKLSVRAHVANLIGEKYLIPLLHETVDPTSLLTLPQWQRTVIKASHGSGMVEVLVNEPDDKRKQALLDSCTKWLNTEFSLVQREILYRGIPPRILVEQYIGDGRTAPVDYKFHMFKQRDGSFQYVLQVIYNRLEPPLTAAFFVNNMHAHFPTSRCDRRTLPCARTLLKKALELSEILASDFDYVRVDWYIYDDRIYFGELTFTPGAGLVTGLDNGLNQLMGLMWEQKRAPAPSTIDVYHPDLRHTRVLKNR